MSLQSVAAIAGLVFTFINLLNLLLTNRLRADIAELKLQMAEARAKDKDDLRGWMEKEFPRTDVVEAKLETLRTHLSACPLLAVDRKQAA